MAYCRREDRSPPPGAWLLASSSFWCKQNGGMPIPPPRSRNHTKAMKDHPSESPPARRVQWIFALTGVLLLVLSAVIGYGYYIAVRFQTYYSPLVLSIEKIEKTTVDSYRIAAEAARQAVVPSAETVLNPLEEDLRNFQEILTKETRIPLAILSGDGTIDAEQIERFVAGAGSYRETLSRWLQSEVRTDELKRIYDESYLSFLSRADEIEDSINESMARSRGRFQLTMAVLIGICIALAVLVSLIFRRYEKRNVKNYVALADAHRDLQEEIRERVRMENELRRGELLFRTVFETSPDPIILTRLDDGCIVDINGSFTALTGFSKKEVIGKTVLELEIWHEPEQRTALLNRLKETGAVRNREMVFRIKDGGLRTNLISAEVITIDDKLHILTVVRDISELKKIEDALKESEEKFRSLFHYASDFIQLLDLDGRILLSNPAVVRRLGYADEEMVGRLLTDFMDEQSGSYFTDMFPSIFEKDGFRSECSLLAKDGRTIPLAYSAAGVRNSAGENYCAAIVLKDISERKGYEKRIQASIRLLDIANRHTEMRPLLKAFIKEIKQISGCEAVAVRIMDEEGNIPYAEADGFSSEFCTLEGSLSIHSDRGMCVQVLQNKIDSNLPYFTGHGSYFVGSTSRFLAMASDDQKKLMRNTCHRFGFETLALIPIRLAERTLGLVHVADPQNYRLAKDTVEILEAASLQLGTAIQRVSVEEALQNSHAELEARVKQRTQQISRANEALLEEIRERRRTEQELLDYQQRLRSLSSELIQTQEQERRLIATEIHDRIGQALAVTKIKLGGLQVALGAGEASQTVEEIRELVAQTIRDTRTLTFELSPPVLYELGLQAALEWLAEFIRKQSELRVAIAGDGADEKLNTHQRVFLFRAVRELLYNIVKHAGATEAEVRISSDPGGILIEVADDGAGFDIRVPDEKKNGPDPGFGLFSIREQLQYYGGRLDIESEPGKGTRVTLFLPVEA